jgi:hypothetical protein
MIGFIYTLNDPETGEIRYIGQTVNSVHRRLTKHISDSKRLNTHVNCWIKSLIKKGIKPVIQELDSCLIEELDQTEIYWISQFKNWGFNLVNLTEGGSRNKVFSKDVTNRISKSLSKYYSKNKSGRCRAILGVCKKRGIELTFESLQNAQNYFNTSCRRQILDCINGKREEYKDFKLSYI